MSQPPLARKYPSLLSVPDELKVLHSSMRKTKGVWAKSILGLLLLRPQGVVIGTLEWRTKTVIPSDKVLRVLPFEVTERGNGERGISAAALDHAVKYLQSTLRHHGLPYNVSKTYDPAMRGGVPGTKGGQRYIRDRVPYQLCLVDLR